MQEVLFSATLYIYKYRHMHNVFANHGINNINEENVIFQGQIIFVSNFYFLYFLILTFIGLQETPRLCRM